MKFIIKRIRRGPLGRRWLAAGLGGLCLIGAGLAPERAEGAGPVGAWPAADLPVEEAVARINELRREIARHDDLYFRLNAPEISDFEYDQLKAELLFWEKKHSDETFESGPVDPVGDDRMAGFVSHRHRVPMLSLDKAMSEEDLLAFHRRMVGATGKETPVYWVEPKWDGIAISLTYGDGRLIRAVTRGNGTEGDDISANVLTIEGLPTHLKRWGPDAAGGVPARVEIRGEIFMSFAELARINQERREAGEVEFANPRNLAAGTARLRDPREAAERRLELVCFGWGAYEPEEDRPRTMEGFRDRLVAWGLPVPVSVVRAEGWEKLLEAVREVERGRESYPFPIDGAVVKLFETEEQDRLGLSRAAPQWAVAVKFAPERAVTRLVGITLQLGRTGVVTPVAELEAVQLAGSRVARASLHNAEEIARRDLRIGDYVYVEKAGDIIPTVVGRDESRARGPDSQPYRFPIQCPECGVQLLREEGRTAIRCVNDACPARLGRQLENFASALSIRGLGPATLAALIEGAGVGSAADLYQLRAEDLEGLPGLGARSAEALVRSIAASRAEPWEKVVLSLGIPGVGEQRAGLLARVFPDFGALGRATREQLTASETEGGAGLGGATAEGIATHLAKPGVQRLLQDLNSVGFQSWDEGPSSPGGGTFANEVVVVTGVLGGWSRAEITALLLAEGARVGRQVTGETTLLVAGDRAGANLGLARSLGVAVMDEAELRERLPRPAEGNK